MTTQICRKCGEEKTLEEFSKESKAANGRIKRCKKCVNKTYTKRDKRKTIPKCKVYCARKQDTISNDDCILDSGPECKECPSRSKSNFSISSSHISKEEELITKYEDSGMGNTGQLCDEGGLFVN